MDYRLLKRKEVKEITGIPYTSMTDLIASKKFPAPIRLSTRSVRWVESEIQEWIENKMEER